MNRWIVILRHHRPPIIFLFYIGLDSPCSIVPILYGGSLPYIIAVCARIVTLHMYSHPLYTLSHCNRLQSAASRELLLARLFPICFSLAVEEISGWLSSPIRIVISCCLRSWNRRCCSCPEFQDETAAATPTSCRLTRRIIERAVHRIQVLTTPTLAFTRLKLEFPYADIELIVPWKYRDSFCSGMMFPHAVQSSLNITCLSTPILGYS
jgi:hypothetical protein